MRPRALAVLLILAFAFSFSPFQQASAQRQTRAAIVLESRNIPAPQEVLRFTPGDDRKLASWNQILTYFSKLDQASERMKFEALGKTTMDKPFVMAIISAPENLARLEEYRRIQDSLADPRKLGQPGVHDRKAADLITRGKTIVLITCGIHSTEVGSTLSSMLIAHRLASSNEPEIHEILRNTIVLLVPSLNPDGVDIVKNWYDKTLGTPYEGTSPPELYHKYVGHDNNRDWYAFTQVETQITVDKIHNVWHPQIVHDIHQMGSSGARLFLPPYMRPVEPNVPKQIVEAYTQLGQSVALGMREQGFKGIVTDAIYDAWTPARAYSHYHGGVRILSETASARIATPTSVKFENLRVSSDDNYDPKKASANFPEPWPGGEWRLRDITNYMTTAAFGLMRHAAQNRERWLRRFYEIGREAVRVRQPGELYGFQVTVSENSIYLLKILERAGVKIEWIKDANPVDIKGTKFFDPMVTYPSHTFLVPMAQRYGAFAKALLERQRYPNLRDSAGHPIAPYDVTAHTLPLLMGVEARPVVAPFKEKLIRNTRMKTSIPDCNSSGRVVTAIYKSHVPAMDEGWTRWVLGRCYEHESLIDSDVRKGNLRAKYDTIIIPDQSARAILEGHRKGAMPEEYTGGLWPEGVKALREFVEQGGTLVCLNNASNFAIEQFKLPLRNVVAGLPRTDFYVPGSILRIELDASHPIAKGMPKESIAWAEDSPVFEVLSGTGVSPVDGPNQTNTGGTTVPQLRVIAWYAKDKNPLLSGWLLGGDQIKGKAALVEVTMGKGRIILFGFRPQYRAQSLATYPLFFNAIRGR